MLSQIETSAREMGAENSQNNLICDLMSSRQYGASLLTLEEREAMRRLRREPQTPTKGLRALFALSETPLNLAADR